MRKNLYKASIFFAVIGLTLMYFSTLYLEIDESGIGEIEMSWTGKNVKIEGNVSSYSSSGGHAFITLKDSTGEIQVVDFDSQLEFEEGATITVIGNVDTYRGNLQVVADEIQK